VYLRYDLELVREPRHPIQCEGIERGPKRIAEVAVNASVNPQAINWGAVLENGGIFPPILSNLW
jgi:hypothetical protein